MTLFYCEKRALLTVYNRDKAYQYAEVPLCIYWKCMKLLKQKAEGKIWNLVKPYSTKKENKHENTSGKN